MAKRELNMEHGWVRQISSHCIPLLYIYIYLLNDITRAHSISCTPGIVLLQMNPFLSLGWKLFMLSCHFDEGKGQPWDQERKKNMSLGFLQTSN